MFDHRRSVWLPEGEKFNAPILTAARIDSIVIHYIGTARAPSNSAQWMLNEHRRSMGRDPGYAFMYNAHVALDGQTWEGRGLEFRNAANGSATNPTTWSIVFAVDGQNGASEAQIAGGTQTGARFLQLPRSQSSARRPPCRSVRHNVPAKGSSPKSNQECLRGIRT
jgi:hypothetical protein